MLPYVGASLVEFEAWWGRRLSFYGGFRVAHLTWTKSVESDPARFAKLVCFDFLEPRLGISLLMKPKPSLRSKWIGIFKDERFRSRLVLSTGISFQTMGNITDEGISNIDALGHLGVVRSELRYDVTPMIAIKMEHRFFTRLDYMQNDSRHVFDLVFSVRLGKDWTRNTDTDGIPAKVGE
jgi:hypothetical protein